VTRTQLVAAAGVLGVAVCGLAVWASSSDSPPTAPERPRAALLGPATAALGINEAVSYPLKLENRQGPPSLARLQADARATQDLGVRWTRGHTAAWPRLSHDRWEREGRSWARMDTWVQVVQSAGLAPLAMVSPWPGNKTREDTDRFVLDDPAAYQAFVQAAVERYDGDGIDDMPGLAAPIHHWEIDNEPDLKNLVDLRTGETDDFATPAQFAQVLLVTAAAIRAADPEAVVVGGGFNRVTQAHGHGYMLALFQQAGVLDALDVVSVHAYHQGPGLDTLVLALQRTREAAPGKPIWLTETSVPAEGRGDWLSEDWQAQLTVATVLESLAWGVEKVFWHTLFDPPPQPGNARPSGTRTNSLLRREPGGALARKPAADAWLALAELLEGVDRSAVRAAQASGGRAWQVGSQRVVWGHGSVSVRGSWSSAQALLGGQAVPVDSQSAARVVDAGAHGGLVVLGP